MVRVLITGGTGFIGAHLVRSCLGRGDSVSVLTRPGSDLWRLEDMLGQVSIEVADPRDAPAVTEVVGRVRPEQVFLLAAATRFPVGSDLTEVEDALRANVAPLRLMLDVLAVLPVPPKAVVRAGTLAEIPGIDPAHEAPATVYGLSLMIGTHVLRLWRERTGIPAVTARLSLTYGDDQSGDFFVPATITQALSGRLAPPQRPAACRDLLHVDDAVDALQLIAEHGTELPATINLSTGAPVRLDEVTAMIAALTGYACAPAPDPGTADLGGEDIVSRPPSAELLALGWRPRIALRDGLAQVIRGQRCRAAAIRKRGLA